MVRRRNCNVTDGLQSLQKASLTYSGRLNGTVVARDRTNTLTLDMSPQKDDIRRIHSP